MGGKEGKKLLISVRVWGGAGVVNLTVEFDLECFIT